MCRVDVQLAHEVVVRADADHDPAVVFVEHDDPGLVVNLGSADPRNAREAHIFHARPRQGLQLVRREVAGDRAGRTQEDVEDVRVTRGSQGSLEHEMIRVLQLQRFREKVAQGLLVLVPGEAKPYPEHVTERTARGLLLSAAPGRSSSSGEHVVPAVVVFSVPRSLCCRRRLDWLSRGARCDRSCAQSIRRQPDAVRPRRLVPVRCRRAEDVLHVDRCVHDVDRAPDVVHQGRRRHLDQGRRAR